MKHILSRIFQWMKSHPGRAGTLAGWYQQAASITMAVILIPQIILLLSPTEAGQWFTFHSLIAFFPLMQFGIHLTIARQVAFTLETKGYPGEERNDDFIQLRPGADGINDLFILTRVIFITIVVTGLGILIIIGQYILPLGRLLPEDSSEAAITWYFLGFFILTVVYSNFYHGFLEGLGQIYLVNLIRGTFHLLAGCAVIVSLHMTQSIAVMAVSQFACGLLALICQQRVLNRYFRDHPHTKSKPDWSVIKRLVKVSYPFGLMILGRSMGTAIQVPLIGFLLGAEAVSPFYVAQKIGLSLKLAASHITFPQMPYFTRELAAEKWNAARARMSRIVLITVGFSFVTQAFFYLLSPWIVKVWIGPDQYIDHITLIWLALNFFLISSTRILASFTIASGHNPFVLSSLLFGFISILLCAILAEPFGILGIVWSGLLAGLTTIFWYFPYQGIKLYRKLNAKALI